MLISSTTSIAAGEALQLEHCKEELSIICEAKAIKNETEIEGFRACHIRDGAALCSYFAWLEEELQRGSTISEYEGALKLEEFRS